MPAATRSLVVDNPILHKEMWVRLRYRQMPAVQRVGVLGAIALLLAFFYYRVYVSLTADPSSKSARDLWELIIGLQFAVVVLLAPVVAANAITQEREQQTWDMLFLTQLTPAQIVLGKLLARMAGLALLLALALPVAVTTARVACHDGMHADTSVSLALFVGAYATLAITAIFYTTCGLYLSWLVKRTIYAIMGAYTLVIGVLTLGTGLVSLMISTLINDYNFVTRCPLMWVNPIQMAVEAIHPTQVRDTAYLLFGLGAYLLLTLLMLLHMAKQLRKQG